MRFNGRASTSYLASRLATGSPQDDIVGHRAAVPIPHADLAVTDPHEAVCSEAPATGIEIPVTFSARRVRVAAYDEIAFAFVHVLLQAVDQGQIALRSVPNSFVPAYQLFEYADRQLFDTELALHRAAVLVFQQAGENSRHSPDAGHFAGTVSVGFVTVANLHLDLPVVQHERDGHVVKDRVIQEMLADELEQVAIVIAQNVDGPHCGQPIQQREVRFKGSTERTLPQVEQVARDNQPATLVPNKIEEAVELRWPVAKVEAIPGSGIAQMKIGHYKSLHDLLQKLVAPVGIEPTLRTLNGLDLPLDYGAIGTQGWD